jgi:predicted nucleic acid-binding protein
MARSRGSRQHQRVREAAPPRYGAAPAPRALTGILLDSDVIIEILRGNARIAGEMRRLRDEGVPTYCTAISWAEIYAGLRPGEETATEAFFQARGEVAIDAVTGRRAGAYLLRYVRSHGVAIADALIAAAAATTGLRLWTLNRRHYPMDDVDFYEPVSRAR